MIAGACAGLAGFFEVAAIQGRANASLAAGYGFTGILVAFLARHNPLAIIPVAILFGGIVAAGGLIQRRMGLPDATVLVLQGFIFVVLLASETLYGRFKIFQRARERRTAHERRALVTVLIAMLGGAHPRLDAVHVRGARRVPDREIRPHQPRPRGHAGARRHGGLRRSPTTPARPGSACSPPAAPAACSARMHGYDLQAAAGQRHRRSASP